MENKDTLSKQPRTLHQYFIFRNREIIASQITILKIYVFIMFTKFGNLYWKHQQKRQTARNV